jgi:hypothetical protein
MLVEGNQVRMLDPEALRHIPIASFFSTILPEQPRGSMETTGFEAPEQGRLVEACQTAVDATHGILLHQTRRRRLLISQSNIQESIKYCPRI